ncbi:MAG: hypothetical protein H6531_10200 [Actinobacteria bacterium]|nr:hypothetical protein [Actinomycetota bacterium]
MPASGHRAGAIRTLLELISRGFPTPAEHHMPAVFSVGGVQRPGIDPSPDAPLVAEVIKTFTDAYVGRVSIVRIFAGTLAADSQVHISGHLSQFTGEPADKDWHADHDEDTRGGAISRLMGSTLTPIGRATAGDIVAVSHLDTAETGDTISAADDPVVVEPWHFPHPLLPVALHAASIKDDDKLMRGLGRLQAENPTTQVVVDGETGQLVLWTMGEHQLDLLVDTLRNHRIRKVETERCCRPVGQANGTGRHVKQSGGHGQYGIVHIVIEPLGSGVGFEFVDEVVGGEVPRQFIPSVEKGVRAQMEKGVTGLDDWRHAPQWQGAGGLSSDAAFQNRALALRRGRLSERVCLEPSAGRRDGGRQASP